MASFVFRTSLPGPCPHARPGAGRHREASAPAACAQAGLSIRLLLAAARAIRARFAKVPRTPNSDDARGWPACPRSHRSAPSSAPTTIRTPASPSRLLFPPSMSSRTASWASATAASPSPPPRAVEPALAAGRCVHSSTSPFVDRLEHELTSSPPSPLRAWSLVRPESQPPRVACA